MRWHAPAAGVSTPRSVNSSVMYLTRCVTRATWNNAAVSMLHGGVWWSMVVCRGVWWCVEVQRGAGVARTLAA